MRAETYAIEQYAGEPCAGGRGRGHSFGRTIRTKGISQILGLSAFLWMIVERHTLLGIRQLAAGTHGSILTSLRTTNESVISQTE